MLVSQNEPRIEVYRRENDVWALRDYGPGQRAELESLDVTRSIDEIYSDPLA